MGNQFKQAGFSRNRQNSLQHNILCFLIVLNFKAANVVQLTEYTDTNEWKKRIAVTFYSALSCGCREVK